MVTNCRNCKNMLSKKNKGGLCRNCILDKSKVIKVDNTSDINRHNEQNKTKESIKSELDSSNDSNLIKDFILKEKIWNEEMRNILTNQINYMKEEITVKNKLIEQLICELSIRKSINSSKNNSSKNCTTITIDDNEIQHSTINNMSNIVSANCIMKQPIAPSKLMQWQLVDDVTVNSVNNSTFICSEFEDESEINVITKQNGGVIHPVNTVKGRPTVVTKLNPENDNPQIYKPAKTLPGNTNYASRSKKILILSDSLCSSIKMKEFNSHIINGYAYRKSFPGATSKDLAHYCLLSLQEDKPDTCIINVGTNNVNRNKPHDIATEIMNIVDICHKYGVNDVYVSSIPFRLGHEQAVNDLNNLLRGKTYLNDFILINNSNITRSHICRDNIHLNYSGTALVANNFIRAINGKRGD